MIQKGQIEKIISHYLYKVRIPRYDKLSTTPGGTITDDLSSAIVCAVPGTKVAYAEGDVVLIGFENNELNKPIILGLLYRENSGKEDQFYLPSIEKSIENINSKLSDINNKKLYAHTKYSNDNGITFTSLYEYTDIVEYNTGQETYKSAYNIEINPESSSIYWSIIDSNNNDVTDNFEITTILRSENESATFTGSLVEIPLRLKGLDNIKLDFYILKVPNFDDYHIVLTTDRNTLGSVYGDYMGICVSTNAIPPLDPGSYSWISFKDSIENIILKLENNLVPRVERNEEALYGFNYSNPNKVSDGTGLLDIISNNKSRIDIHGNNNKDIVFNTEESILIDNSNGNFTSNEIRYTLVDSNSAFSEIYTKNKHLSLIKKIKV